MQPFATRKEAMSNNNHDAFSALQGANLALVQSNLALVRSIQLHQSVTSLLPPSCRSLRALMFQWLQLSQLWTAFPEPWQVCPPDEERRHLLQCMLHPWLPASLVFFSGSTWYVVGAWPGCASSRRSWQALSSSPRPMQLWKMSKCSVPL